MLVATLSSALARADGGEASLAFEHRGVDGDARSNNRAWLVGPPGWDVGGELRLITADHGLGDGRALKLTDVGLLRTRVRYTADKRVELFGGLDVLAKQPAYTDLPVFQGATAGLRVGVTRMLGLAASASGGPTTVDDGLWGSVGTQLVFRAHPDQTLSFQLAGGGKATSVRLADADDPWLVEGTVGGRAMFHTPRGEWGTWLGVGLAVPLASAGGLEPNTRLDLSVGSVYAVAREFDVYIEGAIVDRGEADLPATTLPVLDGGFDQRQLVVGVVGRFDRAGGGVAREPLQLSRR